MELFGIDLPIWSWVLACIPAAAVVYFGHILLLEVMAKVVGFFFGQHARWNFLDYTERPAVWVWDAGDRTRAVLGIPWRLRRKTVFEKVFGFRPEGLFLQTDWYQTDVDDKLTELARKYQRACDKQETARSQRRWSQLNDEEVQTAKDAFWSAHALADSLGFEVKISFKDYLSSTVDSFQEEAGVVEEEVAWQTP